jgi:hypothetical protein
VSSALAIAATARVISRLIDDRVAAEGITAFQNLRTSVISPEQIDGTDLVANQNVAPQINLFPYHVGLNSAWRNRFEPSRNGSGQPVSAPPLAIDISFLVSAHSTTDLLPEMLLGLAMQALSDAPPLTRDRVRSLLQLPAGPPPDPILQALQRSRLADQFELIRIVPLNLSADDMQKLWTSIHSRYRPSFCYMVSALLIDSRNSAKGGLPVREYASAVIQFIRPVIDSVDPPSIVYNAAGNQIALLGQQLTQTDVVARFHTGARMPLNAGSTLERALVTLPADLPAGITGVELVRPLELGAPPPKDVNESNLGIFLHRPVFRLTGALVPDVALGAIDNTTNPPSRPLRIRIQPPAQPGQDVQVLLNERVVSAVSRGFTFPGVPGADPVNDPITFTLSGVPGGTYMVRVRVDSADTPLDTDATTGAFTGPAIVV